MAHNGGSTMTANITVSVKIVHEDEIQGWKECIAAACEPLGTVVKVSTEIRNKPEQMKLF